MVYYTFNIGNVCSILELQKQHYTEVFAKKNISLSEQWLCKTKYLILRLPLQIFMCDILNVVY